MSKNPCWQIKGFLSLLLNCRHTSMNSSHLHTQTHLLKPQTFFFFWYLHTLNLIYLFIPSISKWRFRFTSLLGTKVLQNYTISVWNFNVQKSEPSVCVCMCVYAVNGCLCTFLSSALRRIRSLHLWLVKEEFHQQLPLVDRTSYQTRVLTHCGKVCAWIDSDRKQTSNMIK